MNIIDIFMLHYYFIIMVFIRTPYKSIINHSVGGLVVHSELKELYDIQAALNSTTILAITDTAGKITYANNKFCEISQYPLNELIGNTHKIINSNYHDTTFFKNMWSTISQGNTWTGEIRNRAKDGSFYWVDTAIVPFLDINGKPYQYVSIRHDITEQKRLEEKLQKQIIEDQITGLPNSICLKNKINRHIAQQKSFGLLIINIDDFKSFNESLGNYHADQVLKNIGKRLETLTKSNHSTLARTYSDEFALICHIEEKEIESLIKEIFHLFEQPISYLDIDYYITFCIGAVWFPKHAHSYEDLMHYADNAMQIAKANGKNTYALFDESMINDAHRTLQLKNLLVEAIKQKNFSMHYQPQFNALGEIISFESLVRWSDTTLGSISPAEFIPVAEKTGLIIPLGYLLFELVLQDLSILQQATNDTIKVAFNLSLKQFFDKKLIFKLLQACDLYNVSPQNIKIEITEGVSSSKIDCVISIIQQLRNIGMDVELDDYGTGFSSLKHLKDFNINCIKIDQSFIKDLFTHSSSTAIVNSTIQMAHELGFDVIAEGIETEEQLRYLKERGCDGFQGYLLGKPEPICYYQKKI